jgi:hypothetical protein
VGVYEERFCVLVTESGFSETIWIIDNGHIFHRNGIIKSYS